jgi:hypothetical protein
MAGDPFCWESSRISPGRLPQTIEQQGPDPIDPMHILSVVKHQPTLIRGDRHSGGADFLGFSIILRPDEQVIPRAIASPRFRVSSCARDGSDFDEDLEL